MWMPSQTLRGCQVVAGAKMPNFEPLKCVSLPCLCGYEQKPGLERGIQEQNESSFLQLLQLHPLFSFPLFPLTCFGFLGCFDPAFVNKAVPNLNMSLLISYQFSDFFEEDKVVELHIKVVGDLLDVHGGVQQANEDKDDHCGAINQRFIVGNDP